jgi:hypothetical protein
MEKPVVVKVIVHIGDQNGSKARKWIGLWDKSD